jgi:hypothetical protein
VRTNPNYLRFYPRRDVSISVVGFLLFLSVDCIFMRTYACVFYACVYGRERRSRAMSQGMHRRRKMEDGNNFVSYAVSIYTNFYEQLYIHQ